MRDLTFFRLHLGSLLSSEGSFITLSALILHKPSIPILTSEVPSHISTCVVSRSLSHSKHFLPFQRYKSRSPVASWTILNHLRIVVRTVILWLYPVRGQSAEVNLEVNSLLPHLHFTPKFTSFTSCTEKNSLPIHLVHFFFPSSLLPLNFIHLCLRRYEFWFC